MSDLKLVAPDQPTPLERLLLDAAANESPSAEQRMRVRQALGLSAFSMVPPPPAPTGRGLSLGKAALGFAIVGSAAVVAVLFGATHRPIPLTPNAVPFGKVAPGAGPRHFAFHPRGKYIFVTNEMASTVTSFAWDAIDGVLREVQTVSTLPRGFKGDNDTAEIMVHPNGRYLYVSNRGRNSVATFSINPELGTLVLVDDTPTGGKIPRNFNLDPTAKWLFAANQESGDIFIFHVDPKTGRLTPANESLKVDKPVAILFVATH